MILFLISFLILMTIVVFYLVQDALIISSSHKFNASLQLRGFYFSIKPFNCHFLLECKVTCMKQLLLGPFLQYTFSFLPTSWYKWTCVFRCQAALFGIENIFFLYVLWSKWIHGVRRAEISQSMYVFIEREAESSGYKGK